jgi:hypothetical protein
MIAVHDESDTSYRPVMLTLAEAGRRLLRPG